MSVVPKLILTLIISLVLLFPVRVSAETPDDAQKLYDEGSLLLNEAKYKGKYSLNQVYLNGNRTQINTEVTQMNTDLKYKELTEKIIEESL